MRPVVIFDIDGTLSNPAHRLHHVTGLGPKDWTAFFATMADDAAAEPIKDILAGDNRPNVEVVDLRVGAEKGGNA